MKMTPKQQEVFNEIADDGTVKLWVSGYSKVGERVLVAMRYDGRKVNLQVDFLLRKGLIVLGPVPVSNFDGQEITVTERGAKIRTLATV